MGNLPRLSGLKDQFALTLLKPEHALDSGRTLNSAYQGPSRLE